MYIQDIIMYIKYYRKNVFLNFLKVIKGLDFKGRIEDTDTNLRGYEGCYPVYSVFKQLNISSHDYILDIGCGKGLFLYYASKYDFGRIDGIEYSKSLCSIAEQNICRMKDSRLHVYNVDARLFKEYSNYNYFFINNPFSATILEQVAKDIIRLSPSGKTITIIYQFPFNINVLNEIGFKVIYNRWPNAILCFTV